jgi:flagellar hook-associated protein 2
VTANIINDASGARLSIRSSATGEENAFRISATEIVDDGNATTGLSALTFNATGPSSMSRNQAAVNAQALVDGIAVTSATNTLDQVVEGLSIKLNKITSGVVDMTVAADHSDAKVALKDFVSAYNTLAASINSETKYDATTKVAGKLQADRTALSIQSTMRSLIGQDFNGTGSGSLNSLSSIGLTTDSSGGLVLKESKLDDALANPSQVNELLNGGDGLSTATSGFMKRFRTFADAVQSTTGPLESRASGLKSQLQRISDRQTVMERHYAATEARLQKQYQKLDATMSGINSLGSSVSLMIKQMYG